MQAVNAINDTANTNRTRDQSITHANKSSATQGSSDSIADLFTRLLITQLRNQDPLSPMKPGQLVTQFTQMSQVEAMQTMSKLTASSAAMQQSMLVVTLGAQIGSTVMASADAVDLDKQKMQGAFVLASSAKNVKVVLTGSDGVEHELDLGAQRAGDVSFELDPQKLGLPPGRYSLKVETATGEHPTIGIAGELKSVRVGPDGKVLLNVASIGDVDSAAITRFLGRQKA